MIDNSLRVLRKFQRLTRGAFLKKKKSRQNSEDMLVPPSPQKTEREHRGVTYQTSEGALKGLKKRRNGAQSVQGHTE